MLAFVIIGLLFGESIAQSFLSTPANPTYAEVGSIVSLNWTYSHSKAAAFKKWHQSTESNAPIGKSIMYQSGTSPPAVHKKEFTGRAEYLANGVLVLKNVSLQDEGYIRFEVNFQDGNALSNKITLNVTIPPQLTASLQNETIAIEGSNSSLQCTFQARPRPIIKWFLNGKQLSESSRFFITSQVLGVVQNTTVVKSTLNITNAQPDDNAIIKCSADIPFGTLSSETIHRVLYSPRNATFLSDKLSNTGIIGGNITLTCQGASLPPPFYQIFQNGILRSNSTKKRITITSLKSSHQGIYSCIPINYLGSGKGEALNLTVQVPPLLQIFTGHTKTVMVNTTANISCTFYGKPSPNITWYKHNGTMSSNVVATSNTLSTNASFAVVQSVLLFNSVQRSDHATYTCNAENDVGKNSRSIELNVNYQPVVTANFSINHTLVEDRSKNASWLCTVEGSPVVYMSWKLNGKSISIGKGFEIINTIVTNTSKGITIASKLVMIGITRDKSGVLICNASSSIGTTISSSNVIINYAPSMALRPTAINVTIKSSFVLSCEIDSQPSAVVYWKKSGAVINGSNYLIKRTDSPGLFTSRITSNLTIMSATKSDFGNYECVALNQIGNNSQTSIVSILFPPEYTRKLSTVKYIQEGFANYSLVCSVKSNPVASISWFANKTASTSMQLPFLVSQNSTDTYVEVTSVLTIGYVSKAHFANYTCKASNEIGASNSTQQLIVTYKPFVIQAPLNEIYINASQAIELFCDFQSNPIANSYWRRQNQTLNQRVENSSTSVSLHSSLRYSTTRANLNIVRAMPSDSGFYTCGGNNSLGLSERNFTIFVKYKPTFVSVSASPIISAKSNRVSLHCNVKSNPAANIVWFFGTKVIRNDSKTTIQNELHLNNQFHSVFKSTIFVHNVHKNDTGNYTCEATNEIATVQSQFEVVVQYAPNINPSFGFVTNITESMQPYYLACLVEANPMASIEWLKDGQVQRNNTSTKILETNDARKILQSRLDFKNGMKRGDHGLYQCNASNILGSDIKTVDLNIWYGPDFLSNSTGQMNKTKASNASFECKVEGHPAPILEWYKSDKKLSGITVTNIVSTNTRTVLQSRLTIENISKNDSSEYRCEATNNAGNKSKVFRLNVQYKPVLLVTTSNITANESDVVKLMCKTDANPPVLKYNWTKNGILLAESTSTLTIASARESSSGVYACTPMNELGNGGSVQFVVQVQIPARITKVPECLTYSSNINKLSCSCGGYGIPSPYIFWTKNDKSEIIFNGTSFNLTIEKGNDGRYHCHVKNNLAEAIATKDVFFYKKPIGDWTTWSSCNVSCGRGYNSRSRTCNFRPCTEVLEETKTCNASCNINLPQPTEAKKASGDEAWAIVLYVLIPVLAVLCIVMIVWLANTRGCRKEDKEFIVPLNNNLSQPPSLRSMPTRRDIYLPDNNFGVLNSGYRLDETEILPSNEQDGRPQLFDTIEVEMEFGNDDSFSTTDPEINDGNDNETMQTDGVENSTSNGQGNLSFYNTAYTHL